MSSEQISTSGLQTSVVPGGSFRVGVHKPAYSVANLRQGEYLLELGALEDGKPVDNRANFVDGDVEVKGDRVIYEIRNAFPFRGCTYIDSSWAEARVCNPGSIKVEGPHRGGLLRTLSGRLSPAEAEAVLAELPESMLYGIAQNSDDPEELTVLARTCCEMLFNDAGMPTGLVYEQRGRKTVARISDFELFETIANNPSLPDEYKEVMVLRPGVQGGSEVVGNVVDEGVEVFEYLRGNSYIPWGHYAANLAHHSIRYRIGDLSLTDMRALRHLYYQRTYTVLAEKLGVPCRFGKGSCSEGELEHLRLALVEALSAGGTEKSATLWGWNFGYDFSGSGYRLHASHQMIHQQYAMVPERVETLEGGSYPAYSCGDMVAEVVDRYRLEHGRCFFSDLIGAVRTNRRVDKGEGDQSLIVWEDENVVLFVPKAQVSQWELQLMVTAEAGNGGVGNVVEAGVPVRASLDRGILAAQKVLAGLGAGMVTTVEYGKRIGLNNGQCLFYSFLPKLPWSMGAFSEAQYRFICGHYPEDFAAACRGQIELG